jgi:hypothetical protein
MSDRMQAKADLYHEGTKTPRNTKRKKDAQKATEETADARQIVLRYLCSLLFETLFTCICLPWCLCAFVVNI